MIESYDLFHKYVKVSTNPIFSSCESRIWKNLHGHPTIKIEYL